MRLRRGNCPKPSPLAQRNKVCHGAFPFPRLHGDCERLLETWRPSPGCSKGAWVGEDMVAAAPMEILQVCVIAFFLPQRQEDFPQTIGSASNVVIG